MLGLRCLCSSIFDAKKAFQMKKGHYLLALHHALYLWPKDFCICDNLAHSCLRFPSIMWKGFLSENEVALVKETNFYLVQVAILQFIVIITAVIVIIQLILSESIFTTSSSKKIFGLKTKEYSNTKM